MSAPDLTNATWRKSTRSGNGDDANCVEVADLGDVVAVRDSKEKAAGAVLVIGRIEWAQFIGWLGGTSVSTDS